MSKRYLALMDETAGIGQIQEVASEELDGRYPYSYWERNGMNVVKNCDSYGEARAIVDWQESKNSEETGYMPPDDRFAPWQVKKLTKAGFKFGKTFTNDELVKIFDEVTSELSAHMNEYSDYETHESMASAMKGIGMVESRLGLVRKVKETDAAF